MRTQKQESIYILIFLIKKEFITYQSNVNFIIFNKVK